MEDIQVIPSCHDGGMVSLIQSHALLLVISASLNLKALTSINYRPVSTTMTQVQVAIVMCT